MNELNNNGLREQVQDIVHRHYIFVVHHAHKEGLDSVETTQAIQALITKQVRLGRIDEAKQFVVFAESRGNENDTITLKELWHVAKSRMYKMGHRFETDEAQLKDTGGDKT